MPVPRCAPLPVVRSQSIEYVFEVGVPVSFCSQSNRPLMSNTWRSTFSSVSIRSCVMINVVVVVAGFFVQLTLKQFGSTPLATLKVNSDVDELFSTSHALNSNLCDPLASVGILYPMVPLV